MNGVWGHTLFTLRDFWGCLGREISHGQNIVPPGTTSMGIEYKNTFKKRGMGTIKGLLIKPFSNPLGFLFVFSVGAYGHTPLHFKSISVFINKFIISH
jgi:hypothetical protein